MYSVDELDAVVELTDVPWPEAGAPMPVVVATDNDLAIEYYASSRHSCRGRVREWNSAEQFAYVWFTIPYAHTFGEVPIGQPLLYVNSVGMVAIARNQQDFAATYRIASGPEWRVTITAAKAQ